MIFVVLNASALKPHKIQQCAGNYIYSRPRAELF